jgi:DNA primase
MLIAPEDGGEPYDRVRGRLMIPIRDARGRVIGFGGRILGEGEPKYLNSPETVLFDKGRTLYNLDRAGPASRKAGRLIVVEG